MVYLALVLLFVLKFTICASRGHFIELNAQGLGVWLDSRRVAEAETA